MIAIRAILESCGRTSAQRARGFSTRFLAWARPALGLMMCLTLVVWATGTATADSVRGAVPEGATSAHGEGGGHDPVDTNPLEFKKDLAIWTAVVFLILFAILWKFAWGPIARGLDQREQGIADQIAQAERSNREARQLLEQYDQKLAGSGEEVRRIIEQARRDAEQAGRQLMDKARAEAEAEQQRALQEIEMPRPAR